MFDVEATDVRGPLTGWRMTVTDGVNGAVSDAGTWCLPNASMIAHVSVFNELNEPNPCDTDFWGVHMRDPQYHDSNGWWSFVTADGRYNGNQSSQDAGCADTNLRTAGRNYFIDERDTARGSNGGLGTSGGRLWNNYGT